MQGRMRGGGYNPDNIRPKHNLTSPPASMQINAQTLETDASGQVPGSPSYNVYNSGYQGKTYSVKYLGIVDGTMGILSRKMAL